MKKLMLAVGIFLLGLFLVFSASAEIDETWTEVDPGSSPFLYSDLLLMGNQNTLDGDLAKISASLSVAAYSEGSISGALSQMGFDTVITDYTSFSFLDPHHVGYAIGQKQSGDYTIYCVAVRGTKPAYEWFSDVVMDEVDGYHKGFYLAERLVKAELTELMMTDGASADRRIILLTGHSRGAAVANILAGQLTAAGTGKVFCYTFACPAVYYGSAPAYSNIYNFNFVNDLVPRVPPIAWGYTRYGQDITRDIFSVKDVMSKTELDTVIGTLGALNLSSDASRLFTALLSWGIAGGNYSEFDDFLSVATDDTSILKAVFMQGAGMGDGVTADLLTEYMLMLDFWADHASEMSLLAGTEWDAYRNSEEYSRIFAKFDDFAGSAVNDYKTLSSLIPQIRSRYEAAYQVGTIMDLLNIFFDLRYNTLPALKSTFTQIGNAHSSKNYLEWMNQTYYGYEGCKGKNYENDLLHINVKTVSPYCFAGTTGEFEVDFSNVLAIGRYAFSQSEGFARFDLTQYAGYYSAEAFQNMVGLKELRIACDDVCILNGTFSGCTSLKKITYTPGQTGVMADRSFTSYSPEFGARGSLEEIVFEEGVKHISDYLCYTYSYYDCRDVSAIHLNKLSLPSTLESIGDYAFCGCTGLTSIVIPESITSCGSYVFAKCTGLTEVTITTKLGSNMFEGCTGLTKVILPETLVNCGSYVFAYCTGLKEITIESASIGSGMFCECTGLTEITLPETLLSIKDSAFSRCTGLTKITLPESLTELGGGAFSRCTSLKEVTIPCDYSYGDHNVFDGCTSLKKITYTPGQTGVMADRSFTSYSPEFGARGSLEEIVFEEGVKHISDYLCYTYNYYDCRDVSAIHLNKLSLPSTLESIGDYAFCGCTGLTSIVIPESITSCGSYVFAYCSGLTEVTITTQLGSNMFKGCTGLTKVTLPETLVNCGSYVFADCTGLKEITIESASIESYMFGGCTGLTEITLPETLLSIKDYAFSGCTGLTKITLPESLTELGGGAFSRCTSLKEVTIPCDYSYGDHNVFDGCTSLKKITYTPGQTGVMADRSYSSQSPEYGARGSLEEIVFEEGVKHISDYLCYTYNYYGQRYVSAIHLNKLSLPSTLESIGDSAFRGCTGLTSIVIPESITSCGSYVFADCTGLTEVTITTQLGSNMFQGCTGLTKVTLPETLVNCGGYVFADCTGLKEITIESASIESYMFGGCTGLTEITLPETLLSIKNDAFSGCTGLTKITLPESLMELGSGAFSGCTSLKEVTIPCDYSYGDHNVFDGCTSLKKITYTPGQTGVMADRSYSSQSPEYGARGSLEEIVFEEGVKHISDYLCYTYNYYGQRYVSAIHLKKLSLPSTLESIGDSAFRGCTGLTSIVIPESITSCGSYVFANCTGLTKVTLPETLVNCGSYVFAYCTGLKEITIESASIGSGMFSGCTGLTEITLPETLLSIKYSAFSGCTGLTKITLPESLTELGSGAFSGCTSLKEVTIPCDYSYGEHNVFDGCTSLKKITYTPGQTGVMADRRSSSESPEFGARGSLEEIVFEEGVKHISDYLCCTNRGSAEHLNKLSLPSTLESIGDSAFRGCTGLTSIVIPESITSCGSYVFADCTGLTEVTITTQLGSNMFRGCIGLTKVTLPETLVNCGSYVFAYCTGLKEITIESASIGSGMFSGCTGLTEITLPETLLSIKDSAFSGCTGLTKITLPESLTELGSGAFSGCTSLKEVTIPCDYSYGDHDVFSGCTSLKKITYTPGQTGVMADRRFNSSQSPEYGALGSLEEIVFEEGVKHISDYLCYTNRGSAEHLNKLSLPSTLESIGNYAFYGCSALSMSLPDCINSIGSYSLTDVANIICHEGTLTAASLEEAGYSYTVREWQGVLVLPAGVIAIEEEAFCGIPAEKVILPEGCESIGSRAFADCSGLHAVEVPSSVNSIAEDALPHWALVYTPEGSYAADWCETHGVHCVTR